MTKRVRVKICGLTSAMDVDAAVKAGVDAVGFVFADSPRRITAEQARELAGRVPAGVLRVGLFLEHDREAVAAIIKTVELDLLQFHGAANNAFCRSFGLPFIKAVSVAIQGAVRGDDEYPDASGLLYDSLKADGAGGTGLTFDWSRVPETRLPVWLAGGLNPGNVARAIEAVGPDWVDVSSGVERSPGVKDAEAMKAFVAAVRAAAPMDRNSEEIL